MNAPEEEDIIQQVADAILYPEFLLTLSIRDLDKLEVANALGKIDYEVSNFNELPQAATVPFLQTIKGCFVEPDPYPNLLALATAVNKGRPVRFRDSRQRWRVMNVDYHRRTKTFQTVYGLYTTLADGLMKVTIALIEWQ